MKWSVLFVFKTVTDICLCFLLEQYFLILTQCDFTYPIHFILFTRSIITGHPGIVLVIKCCPTVFSPHVIGFSLSPIPLKIMEPFKQKNPIHIYYIIPGTVVRLLPLFHLSYIINPDPFSLCFYVSKSNPECFSLSPGRFSNVLTHKCLWLKKRKKMYTTFIWRLLKS